MSRRLDGGIIGNRPNWGPDSSSGIWSLDQQISRQRTGLWPTLGDLYFDYVLRRLKIYLYKISNP